MTERRRTCSGFPVRVTAPPCVMSVDFAAMLVFISLPFHEGALLDGVTGGNGGLVVFKTKYPLPSTPTEENPLGQPGVVYRNGATCDLGNALCL